MDQVLMEGGEHRRNKSDGDSVKKKKKRRTVIHQTELLPIEESPERHENSRHNLLPFQQIDAPGGEIDSPRKERAVTTIGRRNKRVAFAGDDEIIEKERFGVIDSDEELEINVHRPHSEQGRRNRLSLINDYPELEDRIIDQEINADIKQRVQ